MKAILAPQPEDFVPAFGLPRTQPAAQKLNVGEQNIRYNDPMKSASNGHLLERLLNPIVALLDEDAARKFIRLKSDRQVRARVAKLADKCNEGELTPQERSEYEAYVMAGEIIAIMQAQARVRLSRSGPDA